MMKSDRVVWYNEYFILAPYFFEKITNDDLQTCTVTRAHYLDMLTHHAIFELQRQNALSEVVRIQDGIPPHVGSSNVS